MAVDDEELENRPEIPEGKWPPAEHQVAQAQGGNRVTLGDILAEGYPRLVGFYRGMGLSLHEAEDLASEICENVVRGITRLREAGSFEAWFWSIARNRFRTALRKRGRRGFEPMHGAMTGPEDATVDSEDHSQIRTAFGLLSVKDRELLWLREVEGLSYEAIAGRFASRPGSVRVAVHRARLRLEEAYGRLQGDG